VPWGQSGGGRGGLVERDRECAAIDRALARAGTGDGALQLFEGPAGIGKTALLGEAGARADREGLRVLTARGGELETGFPYGVVRQLLEPELRSAEASVRERWLAGAAGLAGPAVLGPEPGSTALADPSFAVLHGLYWLVCNLATDAPLAVLVDDVHWSDAPSLRFLVYLARRLEGLSAVLFASIRTGENGAAPEIVGELLNSPGALSAVPAALSEAGVASMFESAFGCPPDDGFARACHELTAGNPFLVRELAAALLADGIEPTAEHTPRVQATSPRAIARATLGRLGRLSAQAVEVARAIAVLGADATLPRAARLAGLDDWQALAALDGLIAADVVPGAERLEFAHPIVRTAIYEELPEGERSATHRRIADLLAAEGAELDTIAGHLLLSRATGSLETIATLRASAAHALELGAPDSAANYLTRALEEGCERGLRTMLLLELAGAEKLARQPAAIEHFEEVRRIAEDPVIRATAAVELAEALVFSGDWQQPLALLDEAAADARERAPELALMADVLRTTAIGYDPRLVGEFDRRQPAMRELAGGGGASARPLSLMLAGVGAHRGEPRDQVVSDAERGWDDGRYLTEETVAMLAQGMGALTICDELDRAMETVDAVRESARLHGSVLGFIIASAQGAVIETRRGDLAAAEADLRSGCERALEFGVLFAIPTLLWYCQDVLLERPDTADVAALAETIELGPMAEVFNGAFVYGARGLLRFRAGERPTAIEDMRRMGAMCVALSFANPNAIAWRSPLALMIAPDDAEEALELVSAELADARRIGQPRGIGVALRALGMLEQGDTGRSHLEQAVTVLASSPARLEHARTLVELGAHLRRHGNRSAARTPLWDGLDLASRSGAIRLAERARTELVASGARPRRAYTSGRHALTASELRVAQMAAGGLTSREIAQALFVTTRTIDMHLQRSYSKLEINSRKQLPEALGPDQPPPTRAGKDW
jgi:DNA-binding CsgD family transcriptional regulator